MNHPEETVFVVDDDPSVRKAVVRLLRSAGLTGVAYASAREFLEACGPDAAGCAILDLAMPGLDGLQLQQALVERNSTLPIIFLTGHGDIPASVQAMKKGAVDFLTKPAGDDALLRAVRDALGRSIARRQARDGVADIERRVATLTPREREVLTHLVLGKLNKQIAADLGTVEKTIKVHRARIMQKMQVRTLVTLGRLVEHVGIPGEGPAER